jgi:low affinity Fe/Cu permease
MKQTGSVGRRLEQFSSRATAIAGSTFGFIGAAALIAAWLFSGPLFQYSNAWQLTINTLTTIVTFLMVFLIQRSQNKESLAVQLKLNELVAAKKGASNRLIDIEDLDEQELQLLHEHFRSLVEMSKTDVDLTQSHSIEEAQLRHEVKSSSGRRRDKSDAGGPDR